MAEVEAMRFAVRFTESAAGDLAYFAAREQRLIAAAIALHLGNEANRESRRRKKLKPNALAPWELKVRTYRVFYDLEAGEAV